MDVEGFQTPRVDEDPAITLRLTAGEAKRIIRALEQTSLSICGSPSASRLAGTYMRLAGTVRRQAQAD
jgi:hypothetical protein